MFFPRDSDDLCELVSQAAGDGTHLEVRGSGSKRDIGSPLRSTTIVGMEAFQGIVDYEPSELVLTVRTGTALVEVEALLEAHNQMLAFEPWDHNCLFSHSAGAATIGGIVAGGVAGSRRLSAGGVRDHLLGFSAVSGRGEAFKAGGKVVKNVTGFDLSKVMAGSWGQLAILTEITLKVLPRPRVSSTLLLRESDAKSAMGSMAMMMGSYHLPAAAAYLPKWEGKATICLRFEGVPASVRFALAEARKLLSSHGEAEDISPAQEKNLWSGIRTGSLLASSGALWRVHLAPSKLAAAVTAFEDLGADWLCDWAGALMWVSCDAHINVREIADRLGAHAMLVRASLPYRKITPARHAESPGVTALANRVKQAFDPANILDPKRFS